MISLREELETKGFFQSLLAPRPLHSLDPCTRLVSLVYFIYFFFFALLPHRKATEHYWAELPQNWVYSFPYSYYSCWILSSRIGQSSFYVHKLNVDTDIAQRPLQASRSLHSLSFDRAPFKSKLTRPSNPNREPVCRLLKHCAMTTFL